MNRTPEISILLPIYNAADTLDECLDSIAGQTLDSYEVLAVDDGSQDASAEIVRRRAVDDPRIRLLEPGRVGLVRALNLGIEAARAPLLARMDADDLMLPERLRLQRDYLHQHPDVALVGCRVELFPPELVKEGYREYVRWQNACVTPEEIAANIYVESPLAHPSVMMRRSVVERLGGYADGPFPEDYELWLRMHHAGCRMAKVPEALLRWRERGDRTSRVDPRYAREAFDRLRAAYLAKDDRLRAARGFVVWGAGRKTRQRVRPLFEQGLTPAAWIDIDPKKIGNTVWGRPVRPAEWLINADPRPFVLIYVARHGAREEVVECLEGWGYRLSEDYLAVG
ncbi:MAG: glycosyltransferase [Armatimonadetes bacterium]|nr:glycosyltransferase [Armatimonadota bacterium]